MTTSWCLVYFSLEGICHDSNIATKSKTVIFLSITNLSNTSDCKSRPMTRQGTSARSGHCFLRIENPYTQWAWIANPDQRHAAEHPLGQVGSGQRHNTNIRWFETNGTAPNIRWVGPPRWVSRFFFTIF